MKRACLFLINVFACMGIYGQHKNDSIQLESDLASIDSISQKVNPSKNEFVRLESEIRSLSEKVYGMTDYNHAIVLGKLAIYNDNIGKIKKAIDYGIEGLNIMEKILGKEHPDYATSLNNLASYYSDLGNYQEAIRLGTEDLNITEKVLGKEHPDCAASLYHLANFYYKIKEYTKSKIFLKSYLDLTSNLIEKNFNWLITRERNLYWEQYKNTYTEYLPQCDYTVRTDTGYTKMDYDAQLMTKGLLLNTEIDFSNIIHEQEQNKNMTSTYEEWRMLMMWINKLYEKNDSLSCSIRKSSEARADSLERILLHDCKAFGDYTKNLSVKWQDVQSKLNEDAAAIEFTRFHVGNDSIMYCALVIRKKEKSPILVPLFEEKQLTNIPSSTYYTKSFLCRLIWDPLEKELDGVRNIYFSPSGALYNIGMEYLPLNAMENISDKYNFYRLSSTRELVLSKDKRKDHEAVLYGGLKYDIEIKTLEAENRNYGNKNKLYPLLCRGLFDSLSARSGFDPLNSTLSEIKEISHTLHNKGLSCILYTGNNGTEESFKNLSGKKISIIHMATHGMYIPSGEAVDKRINENFKFIQNDNERNRTIPEDIAMTRSFLVMSGGNMLSNRDSIPEGFENGILTALEISKIDLRGLDLLVLSACQTALGDISSEGVMGLQRGFKKAGAQTIVMSLWSVEDEPTKILMTAFYQNLANGASKRQSFLAAQKYLRSYDHGKYNHPEYWAAFIILDGLD